jgi:hypothetical protein
MRFAISARAVLVVEAVRALPLPDEREISPALRLLLVQPDSEARDPPVALASPPQPEDRLDRDSDAPGPATAVTILLIVDLPLVLALALPA